MIIGHPASVLYVPRAGRKPIGGFVRRETEVTLRTASAGDFEPLASDGLAADEASLLYQSEGAFWKPLQKTIALTIRDEHFVSPIQFLDWLATPKHVAPSYISDNLGGTPLLATWTARFNPEGRRRGGPWRSGSTRGEGVDPLIDAREVHFDGTDAARTRVVRFIDEDIRVTQNRIFQRVRPLIEFSSTNRTGAIELRRTRLKTDNGLYDDHSLPVHPAMAEAAARRWFNPEELDPAAWKAVREKLGDVPPHEADLDLLANVLPGAALDLLWNGPGQARDAILWEEARDRAGALRAAAFEGLVGGNSDLDREPLFKEILAAVDAVTKAYPDKKASRFLRMASLYIEDDVLPRIRRGAREIEPDDTDALGMLAP